MQISDLPYPDPGVPDARSGPRFLLWLGRGQLGGQAKSLAWGLLHHCGIAGLPFAVGFGVEAVVKGDGRRLLLVGALIVLLGIAISVGDAMLHRTAVTNWITAAARVQQLLARRTAELGAALTRRVAAGEVVAVSTGDVEKIGWFVEAVSRFLAAALAIVLVCVGLVVYAPALGAVVAVGMPVLALASLPLLPRATRRADFQREKAGRATELASDTVAGLRVLRGIGGEELFLGRYREASQQVRSAAVRSAKRKPENLTGHGGWVPIRLARQAMATAATANSLQQCHNLAPLQSVRLTAPITHLKANAAVCIRERVMPKQKGQNSPPHALHHPSSSPETPTS